MKTTTPESLLRKCQAGGLQPYLKGESDADFFPCEFGRIF